jgi:cell wall-associated NlpC family hydrolase
MRDRRFEAAGKSIPGRRFHRIGLFCAILFSFLLAALLLASCTSFSLGLGVAPTGASGRSNQEGKGAKSAGISGPKAEVRSLLVEEAEKVLGAKQLVVKGREFRIDCTGVVQAIYWGAGIDLVEPLRNYSGNGVARLYAYLEEMEFLKGGSDPLPGDLIFWDDTYDRNENGKVDDPFTHVGMVVSIDGEGNLEYIHHNYRRGIILERMNPRTPSLYSRVENGETVIVNSPMRMRGSPEYDKTLAGELVRSWGEAWKL